MKNLITSKSRFLTGITLLFAILMFSNSCSKSSNYMSGMGNTGNTGGTGGPGTNQVFIQGMAFDPATITVAAGTTITWTNKDAVAHTVTSDANLFDSGSIATNGTFSHTFATAGTFPYHCTIHTYMTGSVTAN
jgi:plastocyanin